ncbi:MAG: hypothetical protein FWG52_04050 [Proteobacteria bacterium]|nr:hypothetical protein [Pseudomonadota bacterium]
MISLTPVIQRLTPKPAGFAGLWFRQVAGAAEFAQVRPEALPLPACWVIRASDRARHAGERAEHVTLTFDVAIAIENARRHAPGETDDMLLAYRRAVKDILLGWEPEPGARPIKFDGGRVLEVTELDLYWADRYTFEAVIDNYLPDPPPFESIEHKGVEP